MNKLSSGEKHSEVVIDIKVTDSDDYSLIFTTSAMYFFQDDDESSDSKISHHRSDESVWLQLFKRLARKKRMSAITEPTKGATHRLETITRADNPVFLGEKNAFCIEIIAVDPHHEECLLPLFECAFDCFPDKDYCVMTVPHEIDEHCLTNFFSNVPQRYDQFSRNSLHVMHKNTILGKVSVKVGID